ncbi:MAG: respiratory nitrate reductase subunit gamma [Acetobacteraceae bacterium]|nr:respiratory nitrate reductase subunit gamma [Acetobacteraceae bacterium]
MEALWSVFTSYLNHFLFGIYPYICAGIFLVGSLLRFDRDQYTWRSGSSQLLRSHQLRWGSNLFHFGILFIFLGHFVGLLTPHWVYDIVITAGQKQVLAIVVGGIAGALVFVGLSLLLHRRLFDLRIRRTSTGIDIAILALLWVQASLGLITLPFSLAHLDGSMMMALSEWAQRIVTLRAGAADYVLEAALPFKMHMVLGMTLFLLTPFSRLVHIFSIPVWYLFRSWQIVRHRGGATARPGPVAAPHVAARRVS